MQRAVDLVRHGGTSVESTLAIAIGIPSAACGSVRDLPAPRFALENDT
jgi:hypothetical protein